MPKRKPKPSKRRVRTAAAAYTLGLTPGDEMSAAVTGVLARDLARAVDRAAALESIGCQALTTVGELTRNAAPDELLHRSHALRALVLHGLDALTELQSAVGCLAALAVVREAEFRSHPDGSDTGAEGLERQTSLGAPRRITK